jgi:hypothetical protein
MTVGLDTSTSLPIINQFPFFRVDEPGKAKIHCCPVSIPYNSGILVFSRFNTLDFNSYTGLAEIPEYNIQTAAQHIGIVFNPTDAVGTVTIVPAIAGYSCEEQHVLPDTTKQDEKEISDLEEQRILLQKVSELVDELFMSALEIEFEDGMMSSFSKGLYDLILNYGYLAMQQVTYLITKDIPNPDVSSEALRWLGRLDDASTYDWRLWLLKKSLTSDSPLVRDGAALGLTSMHDKSAIPDLQEAISQETIAELRTDLRQVLDGLNATSFKEDT